MDPPAERPALRLSTATGPFGICHWFSVSVLPEPVEKCK